MRVVQLIWADSRGKVITLLLLLWILVLTQQFQWMFVVTVCIAVATTMGLDLVLGKIRFGMWKFSLSSVLTGLLIGMIMDPLGGFIPVSFASIIAVLSKQFFKKKEGKHILNPASVGIVIASLMFNRPVAWWSVAWGMVSAVLIAVWMFFVLKRLRRIWISVTFLIIYILINVPSARLVGAVRLTIDSTVFLFAWVMLVEPVTSPGMGRWKYGWGILVGLLVYVQNLLGQSWTDPLLLGLLGANVIIALVPKKKFTTP